MERTARLCRVRAMAFVGACGLARSACLPPAYSTCRRGVRSASSRRTSRRRRDSCRHVLTALDAHSGAPNGGSDDVEVPTPDRSIGLDKSWYIYYEEGNKCVVCFGEGTESCSFCFGEGYNVIGADRANDRQVCPMCNGTTVTRCMRCDGSGIRPSTRLNAMTGELERNPTNYEVLRAARRHLRDKANAAPVASDSPYGEQNRGGGGAGGESGNGSPAPAEASADQAAGRASANGSGAVKSAKGAERNARASPLEESNVTTN